MRSACKLSKLSSFETSPPREIPRDSWDKLSDVYDSVDDIDLFTGGLAEKPQPGGMVGPTFGCIIGKQFNSLLFGDRFFFTHTSGENHRGMTPQMSAMIKKRTLRDILCENTKIPSLQKFVMKKESRQNPTSTCFRTNDLDFSLVIDEILDSEDKIGQPNPVPAVKPQPEPAPKPPPVPKPPPEQKPKPQPVPKPKPPPIQKPKPEPAPKPKPKPIQRPKPPPVQKPKPKPNPNPGNAPCKKDKISFCQWLIPKCATSAKTRADCCKTCG